VAFTYELYLGSIKLSQLARYLGQSHLRVVRKLLPRTIDTQTYRHAADRFLYLDYLTEINENSPCLRHLP